MGRGALTLFPVCAGGRGTGRRSRPSRRLGRRPPCGGTAGALRAPAAPPTRLPASAPAFFRITLPPCAPASPPPPQPPVSRRHTGRRPSRPAGAAFGGLRPPRQLRRRACGPPRRPCGPPRRPSHNPRPTPQISLKYPMKQSLQKSKYYTNPPRNLRHL